MLPRSLRKHDVWAVLALLLAVCIQYAQVLFGNRIPASGDFLFYFAPYWEAANQALRAGRLPLWNPDIYAGAPFLANPQTQLFYPLRWLFIFTSTEKGMMLFAALHAWLAGMFVYVLARRVAHVRPLAALAAALLFALNGWTSGLLVHPVRWGNIPWLPAAILLWELRPPQLWGGKGRRWLAAMVLVWSLSLLAGHTQTFYNQAVIFGAWVLLRHTWRRPWTPLLRTFLLLALVFGLVVLLSAVQLLPTYELTTYSYRSGGLRYGDHAALSLAPWRLALTLLPHYGRNLGQAFGSDAYGEWVATLGWIGLFLAGWGLLRSRHRFRLPAAVLLGGGLLFALGGYNPLDYLFYAVVPGWNLFRVPARWLEAAMFGASLLAALGLETLLAQGLPGLASWRPRRRLFIWLDGGLLLLALALIVLARPNILTLALWLVTIVAAGAALRLAPRYRSLTGFWLVLLLFLELYGASWTLPLQHPTAPQALRSWRTAPARIAAEAQPLCRSLSLSTTTYDPGDLPELRQIYGPLLDERALADLINATKAKEVVAPNLGMIFHIPSLDGFGGGVLPTRRFVQSMGLFLPPQQIVADGRLRETLRSIPDPRLLSLFGVCYVITDKDFDAWVDGIYYDLAFGETLDAGQPALDIAPLPTFPVGQIGLISYLQQAADLPDGAPVAELRILAADGTETSVILRAGEHTAEGSDQSQGVRHRRDLPAVAWRYHAPGHDTVATLPLPHTTPLQKLSIHLLRDDIRLFVRGIAFYDPSSGAHASPPVTRHPWQRIHSGDVKIYRNRAVMPRASFVPDAILSPNDNQTLHTLQDPTFDPRQTLLLAEGSPRQGGDGSVRVEQWEPESIRLRTQSKRDGIVLISDAWYPGWQAAIDGAPVPIWRADLLLRAVPVPAGQHELTLNFRPGSLRWGAIISLLAALSLLLLSLWPHQRTG